MKICYINPTTIIRRPTSELIGRLGDSNEIGLFVPKLLFKEIDTSRHNYENLKKAKLYTYSAINIPFINFEWPIPVTPMFFVNMYRVFKKYDILHMWTYFYISTFFIEFFKLFSEKKLIMSCDTFPSYSIKSGKIVDTMFRIYTTFFKGFLFNTPNKIHLYGNSLLKHAKKIGIRKNKISVISTGINTKKFATKNTNIRNELKIPKNKFVITFIGITTPRKGIDIIIKIARQMQDKIFLIVGDGPSLSKYKKNAKGLKNIIFTGNRRDLPETYKASNAFFLPSRGEGLPGVVMEAMAAGLPVVTTITGCTLDLIKNDYNGYLCKIDDIECMKQSLIKVSRAAKFLGNNGKKKIKELDWDNLIKKYEKMYS